MTNGLETRRFFSSLHLLEHKHSTWRHAFTKHQLEWRECFSRGLKIVSVGGERFHLKEEGINLAKTRYKKERKKERNKESELTGSDSLKRAFGSYIHYFPGEPLRFTTFPTVCSSCDVCANSIGWFVQLTCFPGISEMTWYRVLRTKENANKSWTYIYLYVHWLLCLNVLSL